MNVSELYQLTTWIAENNENDVIKQQYQELINAIQSGEPFEQQKESMFSTLKSISFDSLSNEQIKFLEKLNLVKNLGEKAIQNMEDVFYKNSIDRETAANKISNMFGEAISGIQKLNSMNENLTDLIDDEQYELDDEVLMRVSFTGDTSMNNIEDFKKLGSLWFDIGRGISMAHGGSPKDIKIIGATKGSVILELVTNTAYVGAFTFIIKEGLTITEKIYRVRKVSAEAKLLEIELKSCDDKITEITDNTITDTSEELFKQLKLNTGNQGDKKEALKKSITKLMGFLDKGGDVDFIMKEESEDEDKSSKLLREKIIEIRKLEDKRLLLENNGTN